MIYDNDIISAYAQITAPELKKKIEGERKWQLNQTAGLKL